MTFSKEAVKTLRGHLWPGNIRELQNTVERAVILGRGTAINADELNLKQTETKSLLPEIPDEGISLEDVEKNLIKGALNKADGNRSEAARLLKIPRHVLIYRLEKFNIQ